MKQFAIAAAILFASAPAFADGFSCQTTDGELGVKVYNNTQAEVGTRVGAVMVLSSNLVGQGNRTIAVFRDSSGLLNSQGASYEANVDLRFAESNRKGELVAGTKLGHIDTITVDVAHLYSQPALKHAEIEGLLTITKRNGDQIERDLSCSRYLKN